eukprot:COSAG06_NODE_20776_length_782_cov_0.710102_1_plen_144_part_00
MGSLQSFRVRVGKAPPVLLLRLHASLARAHVEASIALDTGLRARQRASWRQLGAGRRLLLRVGRALPVLLLRLHVSLARAHVVASIALDTGQRARQRASLQQLGAGRRLSLRAGRAPPVLLLHLHASLASIRAPRRYGRQIPT